MDPIAAVGAEDGAADNGWLHVLELRSSRTGPPKDLAPARAEAAAFAAHEAERVDRVTAAVQDAFVHSGPGEMLTAAGAGSGAAGALAAYQAAAVPATVPTQRVPDAYEAQRVSAQLADAEHASARDVDVVAAATRTAEGQDALNGRRAQEYRRPVVSVESATAGRTSATLALRVVTNGVDTTSWVEWAGGAGSHRSAKLTTSGGVAEGASGVQMSGLQPDTIYAFRVVARSTGGMAYGPVMSLRTQG